MPKRITFPPYKGSVTWSPDDKRWVIKVTTHYGAQVPSHEVIQCPVLWGQLQRARVRGALAAHDTKERVCLVWTKEPLDLHKKGNTLINVLEKHYPKLKGRDIVWTIVR